ncbi:E3 ubiquitin-protein ligase MARCH2-like [Contarinia nasturtii]|uniref:E3 ubiquitin-protein ligase MARCH2-like n=1 Tax=Contarinia nasturtii TaxID=265458 RepID=UPI0012D4262D|nr:E3 ubiquitin-protein ligase MARCH2-like [Contarinia nasturtii]
MTNESFDIIFRVAEVSFALWFNGCLWNCCSPEQLWILNPRLLTRQIQTLPISSDEKQEASAEEGHFFLKSKDCWICYDSDKLEPLIQPCKCTGDVSSVHHDCLRKWLAESYSKSSENIMKCKICNQPYEIQRSKRYYFNKINEYSLTIICFILLKSLYANK